MRQVPYIIIGMHRSGTRLLAKLLEKSGIFMGVLKEHNFEALHFLSLNQAALQGMGASWVHPQLCEVVPPSFPPASLLYREHFQAYGKIAQLRLAWQRPAWGWKDPRNTFTLPLWLRLFPGAKVIHLIRNSEAVVHSLQSRNGRPGEPWVAELKDLTFARGLWQSYVNQGRSYAPSLGGRYCELHYEDLCALDEEALQKLEEFCGRRLRPALKNLLR